MVDKLTTDRIPNTSLTESYAKIIYTLNHYTLNSRGDKTPPWRTPLVTRKPVDNDDPHLTNIT